MGNWQREMRPWAKTVWGFGGENETVRNLEAIVRSKDRDLEEEEDDDDNLRPATDGSCS